MRSLRLLLPLWLLMVFVAPLRAQSPIDVLDTGVALQFPAQITFQLETESSDADIVAVTLLYGASRSEALTMAELSIEPARRVDLVHELDTQVYYFAPGTDISYRWLIRDAAGNELLTPIREFVYHDERFNWQSRSERNVTVYWYEGGDSFGEALIDTSTRTIERLQDEIGATVEEPVKIYVYANGNDMRSALESNEVEWVGGQARPALGLIVAAIAPGDLVEVSRIIPHELSHQVLHQAIENPYGGAPVWFDEGLAVHNQEVLDAGFPDLVNEAAIAGRLIPLEALASSFPADPQQAYLSYAQSHSVVEYLFATYGEERVTELVQAFAQAMPAEQAVPTVLGMSVDDLDAAWRESLPVEARPSQLANPSSASAPPARFDNPVLPAAPLPTAPADAPQQSGPMNWLETLPGWSGAAMLAACSIVLIVALAVGLLVSLRLIGVDKRVN